MVCINLRHTAVLVLISWYLNGITDYSRSHAWL